MNLHDLKSDKPLLIVPIGPSGVGKSTLFRKLQAAYPNLKLYSWDALRHEFYDKDDYRKAWKMSTEDKNWQSRVNQVFFDMIDRGEDIYVDNVNLTPKSRRFILEHAKKRGYKTVAYVFKDIDLDTLIARQGTRGDKNVPAEAVRQQFNIMKGPQPGEFDEIRTAN